MVSRTQRQHSQALLALLSNRLKEDFEGGGGNGYEGEKHGRGEETGRDRGLLSLVMASMPQCAAACSDIKEVDRESGRRGV